MTNSVERLRLGGGYDSGTNFGKRLNRGFGSEVLSAETPLDPVLRAKALTPVEIRERAERIGLSSLVESMIG